MVVDISDESLSLAVLFSAWRRPISLELSCLVVAVQLELADNQSMICPAVCFTRSLCHSDILFVFSLHYDIVNEMPLFGTSEHR